jgi:hypothetical protein
VVELAVVFREPAKRAKDRSPRREPWENRSPTAPEPRQGRKKSRPKVTVQQHSWELPRSVAM